MPKPPIGFCGLGAMGLGMATHLVSRGFFVKGFDVSPAALSSFQKAGGKPAPSLSDSAQDSPLYILMVANQDQAQKALFDANDSIVEALPEGAVLCMCCTVSPMYVKSVGAELLKRNRSDIRLVDCPVSGGAGRAASGDLTIMCGGKAEAVKLASPLLEELTDPGGLFIVEGGLGQGSSMKMCHQVLAVVQILAVGETLGFAAHLGLEAEEITKRVLEGEAWSWMFQNRSPRSIRGQFEHPVSALSIITKDSVSSPHSSESPINLQKKGAKVLNWSLRPRWSFQPCCHPVNLALVNHRRYGKADTVSTSNNGVGGTNLHCGRAFIRHGYTG